MGDAKSHIDSVAAALLLVERADDEPVAVRDQALAALGPLGDEPLDAAQATTAWALGLALRHLRDLGAAEAWLRRSLAHFALGTDDHTRVSLTLAGTLAFAGDMAGGVRLLDGLGATGELAGRVNYQRAALAERMGEIDDAAVGYQRALAEFRATGDRLGEAHALTGVGLIGIQRGEAADAADGFELAQLIYGDLGLELLAAIAEHNCGLAATRLGDFERAAERFETAASRLSALGEPFVEVALDQVQLLLLLGRPADAAERARVALAILQESGASTDRAELLVALGVALHREGRGGTGDRAFDTAERLFVEQGRPAWQAVVELRRLETQRDTDDATERALEVAESLRSSGLSDPAADADVFALDRPDLDDRSTQACLSRLRELPVEDLRRTFADASGALMAGEHAAAGAIAHDAVTSATQRIVAATSLEVRSALLALRDRIARVGVAAALASSRPDALVALLFAQQRGLFLSSSTANGRFEPFRSDRFDSLVAMYDDGEQLVTVVCDRDGSRFVDAPERSVFVGAMRRHAAILADALGNPHGDSSAVDRSADAVVRLAPWLARSGPVALAVNGDLFSAPWSSVAGGPIRVTLMIDAAHEQVAPHTTVLVGPGLDSGDAEAEALSSLLGGRCSVVSEGDPLAAIDRAAGGVLHICSHGHHDPVRPLASSYQLADGRVTAEAIHRIGSAPALVVAAACRSGATHAVGSSEIGLPTAWIASGSNTVVASAFALPDDDRTVRTMAALHASLAGGRSAETAIIDARDGDELVARSLVVVGRAASWASSDHAVSGAD